MTNNLGFVQSCAMVSDDAREVRPSWESSSAF